MVRSSSALFIAALLIGCPDDPVTPGQTDGADTTGTDDSTGADVVTPDADTGVAPDGETGEPDAAEDAWTPPPCVVGLPCDDNNPCTMNDTCADSLCEGTHYTCDDGRECTANDCTGDGGCEFGVISGFCLLNNVCVDHGTIDPNNECGRCDTDKSKIAWSERDDDDPCEDGNPCTFGDYCKKGTCKKGLKATCDDGNDCTQDSCDKLSGCVNQPASGPCSDGDPCTTVSECSGGVCHAPFGQCDDDNPCTTDTCLPELGCQHVVTDTACEDGDACTVGDKCKSGVCTSGPPADCSDGTECTEDKCDDVFGCYQTLTLNPCCSGAIHVCNDGNPCTTDTCDGGAEGACVNTPNTDACEDGDQCTGGDKCSGGVCQSGNAAGCDDGNPCTTDLCDEAAGCQHAPTIGGCNDGIPCTFDDTCINGECIGDASECTCDPPFSPTIAKTTLLQLGETGNPGDGLDVDVNPATCAPAGKCSGGIDNTLSVLNNFVNENIAKEVNGGGLVLLFELVGVKTDGTPFTLSVYPGKKADKSCDHTKSGCTYLVEDEGLTEDCQPLIKIDNATIKNGKLTAGGPGYKYQLIVPLFGDNYLPIDMFNGALTADVVLDGDKVVSIKNGILGGAVPKSVFVTAIEYIPEADLPVPKENLAQLIDLLIKNDIDTGPPSGPDAASIGLRFEAVGGTIVGVDD